MEKLIDRLNGKTQPTFAHCRDGFAEHSYSEKPMITQGFGPELNEYEYVVRLGVKFRSTMRERAFMEERAKRQFVQILYEEVLAQLSNIEYEIHNRNAEGALLAIHELRNNLMEV